MLQVLQTNTKLRKADRLRVVHVHETISTKEMRKADQNSGTDPGASPVRGFFFDNRSAYVRSNYYPDGPGGNYQGL
ncbi:MAG: hypothetical protein JWP27_322 [Flaviaesturariibacter sp.]|nr:hypothetical protein [Flaviaesturariibacter sp.]